MAGRDVVTAEDVRDVAAGRRAARAAGRDRHALGARDRRHARRAHRARRRGRRRRAVVALGADHGGFPLKEEIKAHLARLGWRFRDLGTFSTEPVDYPDFALAVARAVQGGRGARSGILVDGAGIGSAMAANKVPGVRAALVRGRGGRARTRASTTTPTC